MALDWYCPPPDPVRRARSRAPYVAATTVRQTIATPTDLLASQALAILPPGPRRRSRAPWLRPTVVAPLVPALAPLAWLPILPTIVRRAARRPWGSVAEEIGEIATIPGRGSWRPTAPTHLRRVHLAPASGAVEPLQPYIEPACGIELHLIGVTAPTLQVAATDPTLAPVVTAPILVLQRCD